jgi:hypothetical protein
MRELAPILWMLVALTSGCEEVQYGGLTGRTDCAILYKNNDCRFVLFASELYIHNEIFSFWFDDNELRRTLKMTL